MQGNLEGRFKQNLNLGELIYLVVFLVDEQHYALPLATVNRIVRAVEVTPLPEAPAIVLGAINVEGRIIPVLNLRRRFLLPEREIGTADQFLIAITTLRMVALVIDEALDVIEYKQSDIISSDQIVPGLEQFQGVVKLNDGLVLIHDLEKFLSLEEADMLDSALAEVE
ncbi:MAG TPA: chemotaxis protein CheW [Methylophilaceae bacterium]